MSKLINIDEKYKKPLIVAVVLHIIVVTAIIIGFDDSNTLVMSSPNKQPVKIVQAQTVSEKQLNTETSKIKAEKRRIQQQKIAEQKRIKALAAKKAREKEQKRLAAIKKKQEAVRLAKVKKQQAEKKKKAAALAKKRKLAEAKKKADLAKKQAAEKQRQAKAAADKARLAKAAADKALKAKQAAALAAKLQSAVNQYIPRILNAISRNWIIPDGVNKNLSCEFLVGLDANGKVLSVKLIKSSGVAALDRSAQAAVYKASPLPIPSDPQIASKFNQLNLTVRPENVVS